MIELPIKISDEQKIIIEKIPKEKDENFLPIQDANNYYISDQAKVWNSKTKRFIKGKKYDNYQLMSLYVNQKSITFTLHNLVASHFIPNPNNYIYVRHKNKNKFDNKYTNLYWYNKDEYKTIKKIYLNNIEKIEGEIFVLIKNTKNGEYKDYYISNMGRIWSNIRNKLCTGEKTNNGYLRIGLVKNKEKTRFMIHQLVARHFIENKENKLQVNHINGIKDDNRVINLEWVTQTENNIHAAKYIKKNHSTPIQKLHSKTRNIEKIYPSIVSAKEDKYNSTSIRWAIKSNELYKGFYWEKVEKEKSEEIIEGEIWVNLGDSIYEEVNKFTKYQVSDHGRIRGHKGKILKLNTSTIYYKIILCNDTEQYEITIYKLVLLAFNRENPENKDTVDHIDSDPTNNKLSNLRFATSKEQMQNPETLKKIKGTKTLTIKITTILTGEYIICKGYKNVRETLNISQTTVYKYANLNEPYKGYKFEFI